MERKPELSPQDQKLVDEFISTGIHSVERKPFKPWLLVLMVLACMASMTMLSIAIERMYIP
jgi:hypothetical protein